MDVRDTITVCKVLPLPEYAGLWDSIIVPAEVKDRLLRAALLGLRLRTALPFDVTALHGLVVLHGPPGTGKTTLARGLPQELAGFTKEKKARLVEVNAHGLMSAEHGQSQQKVAELLGEYIPTLADDGLPTVVLLDEVESMAVARSEASLSANPADVHRATDAVLAALDANAVSYPHVIAVATSNFTRALDAAFLSRADVAIEVPLPDESGAHAILQATLISMSKAFPRLANVAKSRDLLGVARKLSGMDGRRIRKTVTEAMMGRLETVKDPSKINVEDLMLAAGRVERDAVPAEESKRGAA